MKSRNTYELSLMRQSGKIAASALKKAIEVIKVGVSELEVDKIAEEEIYRLGGDFYLTSGRMWDPESLGCHQEAQVASSIGKGPALILT